MKINRFITIMAAVLVLLNAAACKSQEASSRASGNRVESVSLPSFDAIENDAAVNIHFTQGDRQSVRVRHAEGWRLKLSVSGKTLKMEVENPDSRRGRRAGAGADVWITLPYLKTVSNDGALHLDAASIKEDRLGIYNNGAMTVDVDKMNIGTFKCANSGSLRYSTKLKANKMSIDNNGALTDTLSASCPDINISNNGALTTSLAVADAGQFSLYNGGSIKGSVDVKGKALTINNCGALRGDMKLKGDMLNFINDGAGEHSIEFVGGSLDFQNSGNATVSLDVDCRKLSVGNSGVSRISVSGTADETTIDSDGISKIDCSKLNKF